MAGVHENPPADAVFRPNVRAGRLSLAERRKSAVRLEVTREAIHLFTTKGVAATTAEDIAAAVGISVRTLWRYFPNKESCVLPLLTASLDLAAHCLRTWSPDQPADNLLNNMQHHAGELTTELVTMLELVRLTRTEPGLRAVWLQAHHDAGPAFAAALAQHTGLPGDDLISKVQAAMINSALRTAVEHYAFHVAPSEANTVGILAVLATALQTAARGLSP